MSTREKKLQTDDCTKLTHHLLITLPKLMSKVIWSSCSHWYIKNSFWRLTLMFFYLQFSSCCDVMASLMKIPQYFLPECINTENTQVCFSALVCNCNINHRFKEYLQVLQATIHSKLVNLTLFALIIMSMVLDRVLILCSSSGFVQLGGRNDHSSGAPLQLCCPGGCSSNLPHPLWGGGSMVLCGAGYQGLSRSALGGPTDANVKWLACGVFTRLRISWLIKTGKKTCIKQSTNFDEVKTFV